MIRFVFRWLFPVLALCAVGLAIYLFFYLGFYKPVTVTIEELGPLKLLAKTHVGPYHEIGPAISAVEGWAVKMNVPCPKTFGEYLDDPDKVDQDRLRSRGGCVLTEKPKIPDPSFILEERPRARYVVARFNGSPAIGPFKAYPAIKKFIAEKRLRTASVALEIYSVNGTRVDTEYLFAIEP